MNKQRIEEILSDWKLSDVTVDTIIDKLLPLFSEESVKPMKERMKYHEDPFGSIGYYMVMDTVTSSQCLHDMKYCFVSTSDGISFVRIDNILQDGFRGTILKATNSSIYLQPTTQTFYFNEIEVFKAEKR